MELMFGWLVDCFFSLWRFLVCPFLCLWCFLHHPDSHLYPIISTSTGGFKRGCGEHNHGLAPLCSHIGTQEKWLLPAIIHRDERHHSNSGAALELPFL
ncbi:hypothetical protein IWX49DRAFT_401303 [Phyllosticta citricarpa]|uniref:Secreted protein n=1 Tax=Phyllosticta citricarpa TaxID=55181 RepID=A0ABR1LUP9_9PEZI